MLTVVMLLIGIASLSCEAMPRAQINREDLDTEILRILEERAEYSEFASLLKLHSRVSQQSFTAPSLKFVHQLYYAQQNWHHPCNLQTVRFMASVGQTLQRLRNDNLKLVAEYLVQNRPIQEYANKCIEDFDRVAWQDFAQDEAAVEFMTGLSRFTDSFVRFRLVHQHVYQDMDSSLDANSDLKQFIAERANAHEEICRRAASKQAALDMNATFKEFLALRHNLRTNASISKLIRQRCALGPNAFKVITLFAFCENDQQHANRNL